MGFQDRDYYRDGEGTSYVTSVVIKLIIINSIVFLADVFFGGSDHKIMDMLSVRGDTLLRPLYWWQFLTAGFAHSPDALNHIFFNMLGLYVFGRPLEERYGSREFLRFYLIAVVVGFLVWGIRMVSMTQGLPADQAAAIRMNTFCLGASGGVTAATLLFCILNPRATVLASFLFPVPAWVIGGLIIVNNLFGVQDGIAYDVHLVGVVFALAYWYFGWNFGRLPGMYELSRLFSSPQKWFKPRPKLKVHDPEQYYENLDAEADRILEKVGREGESSLTAEERRTLEDYSRRMRQKLR